MFVRPIRVAGACALLCVLAGCAGLPQNTRAVHDFSVQRYLGRWYEIARLDHGFEQGLDCVTATYSRRADGGLRVVNRGVDNNAALQNLERVPMLGSFVSRALDEAITDTVNNVLDEAVNGLSSADFDALVQNITDSVISRLLADDIGQTSEVRDAVVEILDLVKEQVAVQRWREHFE